jgi:hypothetical protein
MWRQVTWISAKESHTSPDSDAAGVIQIFSITDLKTNFILIWDIEQSSEPVVTTIHQIAEIVVLIIEEFVIVQLVMCEMSMAELVIVAMLIIACLIAVHGRSIYQFQLQAIL